MKVQLLVMLCAALAAVMIFGGCHDGGGYALNVIVTVEPSDVTMLTNQQQQFDATVTGIYDTRVVWSASGGSITQTGLYTAPSVPGTYYVTATSVAYPDASDTVAVVVQALPTGSFAITPTSVTMRVNNTQQFTPIYTDLAPGATWEVEEVGGGTVDENGLYTAPNEPGTYHVKATSTANSELTATAVITVLPVVAVNVTPGAVTLLTGAQQQFEAAVTGTDNTAVTWAATGGSITQGGLFTAPGTADTYYVTATSVEDPSKSDTVAVTVIALPQEEKSIAISPSEVILEVGDTQQFSAVLEGLAPGVSWTIDEAPAGGSITSGGLYTAPSSPGTYHVTVTNIAEPTYSATATVTVVPPIRLFITPKTVHLDPGESFQFNGHVQGGVTELDWSVLEADGGTISDTGLYTAPMEPGTYHVVVKSVANPKQKDIATVHVDPD